MSTQPLNTRVSIELVPFEGGVLQALRSGGHGWLALKPTCEAIGLDPEGQRQRMSRAAWAVTCMTQATGADGKQYKMFCLRRDRVATWLLTLPAHRISDPAIRTTVEVYQARAADALDKWWRGDSGTAPANVAEHVALPGELRDVIALLVGELQEQRRARRRLERKIAATERPAARASEESPKGGRTARRETPAILAEMGYCSTREMAEALGLTIKAFRHHYTGNPELRALSMKQYNEMWWLKKNVIALVYGDKGQVGHA